MSAINPFSSLPKISPLQFKECPKCHHAIMTFVHDETKIDPFCITCDTCKFSVCGESWREVLTKWNSGGGKEVNTIDI